MKAKRKSARAAKRAAAAVADKYITPKGGEPKKAKLEAAPAAPGFDAPKKKELSPAVEAAQSREWQQKDLLAHLLAVAKDRGGRPTKYKSEFCGLVVEAGRLGKTKTQMARIIGVGRRTLERWETKHKEFAEAMGEAVSHAQGYWEDVYDENFLAGRDLGAPFIFMMKNRFKDPDHGYRDKHEVQHQGNGFLAFVAAVKAGEVPIIDDPLAEYRRGKLADRDGDKNR